MRLSGWFEAGRRASEASSPRSRGRRDARRAGAAHGRGRRALRRPRWRTSRAGRGRRLDADLAAGLAVDEGERPDVGQLVLAGVADLDRQNRGPGGHAGHRRRPVAGPAEVADDDHEAAARRRVADERERARRSDGAGGRGALSSGRSYAALSPRAATSAGEQALATAGRLEPEVPVPAERGDPEAVAALGREVADREGDALGDVRLAAVGRPERHRRRHVEQQPRRERPLRDVDPDVGHGYPRRDVPVDVADVVARLVRPDLGELVPPPRSCARNSPGRRPWMWRPTVTSRARRSASGVGPGPGAALDRREPRQRGRRGPRSCRSLRRAALDAARRERATTGSAGRGSCRS